MFRKISGFVLCIILISMSLITTAYGQATRVNPTREELEEKIEEVAKRRGIPSVILKSIARVESVFQQYNPDGSVYTSRSGSIGLMQIYNKYGWFENDELKYNIDYNIEAGAEVLLMKWDQANEKLPTIGDMNPNILEHWYFALWAYNGWSNSNNPNMVPYRFSTWTKNDTYQDLIYMVAEKEYGQKITPIDLKLLPKDGLPQKNEHFNTPAEFHYGDITMYYEGDIVKADVKDSLRLRNEPSGYEIGRVEAGRALIVLEEPVLKDGYFWYRVKTEDDVLTGWVAGSWISKIGSVYVFDDISSSWAKDDIIKLHELGIVSGLQGSFYPQDSITRIEMSALLTKALNLDGSDFELGYEDSDQIPEWAVEYVKAVSKAGIFGESNSFGLDDYINREEFAIIISKILGYEEIEGELDYLDLEEISPEAISAVKNVRDKGIMEGAEGRFNPKESLTRAGASKVILKIIEVLKDSESTF